MRDTKHDIKYFCPIFCDVYKTRDTKRDTKRMIQNALYFMKIWNERLLTSRKFGHVG